MSGGTIVQGAIVRGAIVLDPIFLIVELLLFYELYYFRAYEQLSTKHDSLTLITPQFETPLPPLNPAVSILFILA